MEEIRTGGKREFFFSCAWTIILLLAGDVIISALPRYKIIGTLITLLFFCVLAFFALTRYSAVYTYSLKGGRLRITRTIGHRRKEVETRVSDISYIGREKPGFKTKNVYRMRCTVFSNRRVWYIVYKKGKNDNLLVCEPSPEMARALSAGQGGQQTAQEVF